MRDRNRFGVLLLFVFLGLVLGTLLGIVLGKAFPILDLSVNFGVKSITLNIIFMDLTFGFQFYLNIGTIIGILVFLYLFIVI